MAAETRISDALAVSACNATVDAIDASGSGTITFYDGTQPAGPDDAVTTQNALAVVTFGNPAFGAAAMVANINAVASVNPSTAETNTVAGTCTWARVEPGVGAAVMDGNVGTVDEAFVLNTVTLTNGGTLTLDSMTHTVPTGAP